jgi:FTR1 family protein
LIPTLVITLREALEASLIIGIVAAFLVREGRRDALRSMWIGVALAVALCTAIAIGLRVLGNDLPQREQEGLETIVGLIAVVMVTYMVVWMKRHSRQLKGVLEGSAAGALAAGSAAALIGMAFLAVLREGFETAVFLLAAFQESSDPLAAGGGAVLGLVLAIALGYALYRGGIRVNLSRFFRATGLVLVLVAAGLLATAVHTAHEAGWIDSLQSQAVDLTWLVTPGSVLGSLLTGTLGLQPSPTVGEALAYLLYAIPMGLYVVWPDSWRDRAKIGARRSRTAASGAATQTALAALGLIALLAFVSGCGSSDDPKPGSKTLAFTIGDAGCDPGKATVPAGPVNIEVTNDGSGSVTEFEVLDGDTILGERENITAGLDASFSLTLDEGEYTLSCPNGTDVERGTLTVTKAERTVSADAGSTQTEKAAVESYRKYVEQNTDELVAATKPFVAAVVAGDVAKAKQLYPAARIPYERIEPVAESFGDLDPKIDAREGDVPRSQFGGFHRIEKALWVDGSTAGMAPVAKQLLADTEELQARAAKLKLQAAQIANGANGLLDEVSASKITGEEERYSHIDLVDFEANVDGSNAAFQSVQPVLAREDPELSQEISDRFDVVSQALKPYEHGESYLRYTRLTSSDTRELSQVIDALAEPLSKVAAQIVE